jgi:uncharacterized OB-fold protein
MPVGPVDRDESSGPFFDGAARGEFLIRRCRTCASASEPQATTCASCSGIDLVWEAASGSARLVSWAVTYNVGDKRPTVLAIAELDEGPWWWSQIADADPEVLDVNMALHIDFDRSAGSEVVPIFRVTSSHP